MAADRTAIDTITGYYYQFDYYILELLKSPDPRTEVCIEAIEDVDITTADETTAVQCKYYAKSEFQLSLIRRPIRLMLEHFARNPGTRGQLRYSLYGYYNAGQDKLAKEIDLDYLKKTLLPYTERKVSHFPHVELGLSDAELQLFLDHLHIDICAPSFQEQEEKILAALKERYKCSDVEAEFYYSNALRLVRELSTKQDVKDRTISTEQFCRQINTSGQLFDAWYLKIRGEKAYCSAVKKQYFTCKNISPYARFFLIDCDQHLDAQDLKALLIKISDKWSKLSPKEVNPFCPYVLLHGATPEMIVSVKKALRADGVYFRDGYDFLGADFDPDSITVKPTAGNSIRLKFLTNLEDLTETLHAIRKRTRLVYQFYINTPYFDQANTGCNLFPIRIAETSYITQMI